MQVDIAPTLAALFNVPIPKNNVGVLIQDALHFLSGVLSLLSLFLCPPSVIVILGVFNSIMELFE